MMEAMKTPKYAEYIATTVIMFVLGKTKHR